MVKQVAQLLRDRASELGMLDAVDSGNPVRSMTNDVLRMANASRLLRRPADRGEG